MTVFSVRICRGPTCGDLRNSEAIVNRFEQLIGKFGLKNVRIESQSCYGRCRRGPNVLVRELSEESAQAPAEPVVGKFLLVLSPLRASGPATMYNHLTVRDVDAIVSQHLREGRPVRRLAEGTVLQGDLDSREE